MDTVDGDRSVEGVMDRIVLHVRAVNSTNHMEMDRIATQNEGLANIGKFNTVDTCCSRLVTGAVHDDNGTILVIR